MSDKELSNKDIQMSKGYAVVSMLMLHLFCLRGGGRDRNALDLVKLGNPVDILPGMALCNLCADILSL